MKYLFNALKEHCQIYLGLFLGLVIGLLVGIGFADWKSLVKAFDSKVTDWIMSLCTIGILIGTWKAASYAKKAAHQARIQNNNVIVSKIDDVHKELRKEFEESKSHINNIVNLCEVLPEGVKAITYSEYFQYQLDKVSSIFFELNNNSVLYKYSFFIENVIGYKNLNKFCSIMKNIECTILPLSSLSKENVPYLQNYLNDYVNLMNEILKKMSDKYQELNGSS